MLEPRKADIPALFLVLVVLPVFLYILLGRWSEASKRKQRVKLVVEDSFERSFRAEPMGMATASAVPLVVPPPIPAFRECARCGSPATTRCSRCKSVRYCSGKCQIIHWRHGHKEECRPANHADSSFGYTSMEEASFRKDFHQTGEYAEFGAPSLQPPVEERPEDGIQVCGINRGAAPADAFHAFPSAVPVSSRVSKPERRASEKRVSRKSTKEMLDARYRAASISTDENLNTPNQSRGANLQLESRGSVSVNSEDGNSEVCGLSSSVISDESHWRRTLQQTPGDNNQRIDLLYSATGGTYAEESSSVSTPQMHPSIRSIGSSTAEPSKPAKIMTRASREQGHPAKLRKGQRFDESGGGMSHITSERETNGATSIGLAKTTGVKKLAKLSRQDLDTESYRKMKVLFPFEEFIRFFEVEIFGLAPRGLLNCGNSCYANAVLQCLTCTKPLVVYLLTSAHSRACSLKNWCLMCELEQHVIMLKEAGGPLSPSRILSHMRGTNCQIGDGSQEDAHEFLRLLVASMQSICLKEVGGENKVHPILQETTFVQQTFGGRLRSMVVCLKCHHESERYENIMDLTLEIFGWVESLEDALTQFTTPEDLDGENMYRCGRCASYVRARKQLNIDEAPNILTIVLKRFQEGNYGKINKCISFPEVLDMVPYMTGTNDGPPLYMLYGVVVHVDTLNASFSGHYVSYVKDLQGNWFRIDDAVVQPVHMSQVMSEGAYILFYMRSSPRPPRTYIRKPVKQQAAKFSRPCVVKTRNSSELGQNVRSANQRHTPAVETYAEPNFMEFSDATSSDWSLFTSSDDASFTSESTRDSFSTFDYSETCHVDPHPTMLKTRHAHDHPSQRTVSCRMFSGSKPVTRYVSEHTGYILDSDNVINPLDDPPIGGYTRQVSIPFNQAYLPHSGYQDFVNYESSTTDDVIRTFSNFQL